MVGDVLVVGNSRGHAPARRIVSTMVAIALLAAMLLVVADRAEAAPGASAQSAVVAVADSAQFSVAAIVCPILLFLRAAFGPFFAGIFDSLLAAFGCINVSPGGSIPDDDDD